MAGNNVPLEKVVMGLLKEVDWEYDLMRRQAEERGIEVSEYAEVCELTSFRDKVLHVREKVEALPEEERPYFMSKIETLLKALEKDIYEGTQRKIFPTN